MNERRMPKADYFRMRYECAVDNGLTQKAKYYKMRLEQMNEPLVKGIAESPTEPTNESPKERALRKCREAFEGLDEGGRLIEANRIITKACENGMSVNQVMAFLKEADVMSDTELMHSITF